MKLKDKETIQRALGIIEGVSAGITAAPAATDLLITAVMMIDEALNGEEDDDGRWR